MLRLIGVAAIVHVTFKGVRSLIVRPKLAENVVEPVASVPVLVSPPEPIPEASEEPISAEVVALIAAAISSYSVSSYRIVSIRQQSSSWELAGRQSILTSHRIR